MRRIRIFVDPGVGNATLVDYIEVDEEEGEDVEREVKAHILNNMLAGWEWRDASAGEGQ